MTEMKTLTRSAREGFIGSFRLAAMIVVAVVSVLTMFAHGGEDGSKREHSGFLG